MCKGFKIGSDKNQAKFYLSICFKQNTSIFTSSKRFLSKIDKCRVKKRELELNTKLVYDQENGTILKRRDHASSQGAVPHAFPLREVGTRTFICAPTARQWPVQVLESLKYEFKVRSH